MRNRISCGNLLSCLSIYYRRVNVRPSFFRSGRRNSVVSRVRSTTNHTSNVVLGPNNCTCCDITVLRTLRLYNIPTIRILVDRPDNERPFQGASIISFNYRNHFTNRNVNNCLRTYDCLIRLLQLSNNTRSRVIRWEGLSISLALTDSPNEKTVNDPNGLYYHLTVWCEVH